MIFVFVHLTFSLMHDWYSNFKCFSSISLFWCCSNLFILTLFLLFEAATCSRLPTTSLRVRLSSCSNPRIGRKKNLESGLRSLGNWKRNSTNVLTKCSHRRNSFERWAVNISQSFEIPIVWVIPFPFMTKCEYCMFRVDLTLNCTHLALCCS